MRDVPFSCVIESGLMLYGPFVSGPEAMEWAEAKGIERPYTIKSLTMQYPPFPSHHQEHSEK